MRKKYLFFLILHYTSLCVLCASFTVKEVKAEGFAKIENMRDDIPPELKIKIDEWMKLLYSEDTAIRSSAIISLMGLNIPSINESLISILRNSPNDDVSISLIKAFGFAGDDNALDSIFELLDSKKKNIQNASAEALGNIKTDRAIEKMSSLLHDPKIAVSTRILLADVLAKTRSRNAVKPLINLLGSEDKDLRVAARDA